MAEFTNNQEVINELNSKWNRIITYIGRLPEGEVTEITEELNNYLVEKEIDLTEELRQIELDYAAQHLSYR